MVIHSTLFVKLVSLVVIVSEYGYHLLLINTVLSRNFYLCTTAVSQLFSFPVLLFSYLLRV